MSNFSSKWSKRDRKYIIKNVPTIIPPSLNEIILNSILLRSRFEEIVFKLANLHSDQGIYDGNRSDITRNRDELFQERKKIIDSALMLFPKFRVPGSYVIINTKCRREVPLSSYKDAGLIIGPRGESQQQLEAEFNVKISIRGVGSVRDPHAESIITADNEKPLHCLILGYTERDIDRCVEKLTKILQPVPDEENEYKRQQLYRLSTLNGVMPADAVVSAGIDDDKPPWFDASASVSIEEEIENITKNKQPEDRVNHYPFLDKMLQSLDGIDISMLIDEPEL